MNVFRLLALTLAATTWIASASFASEVDGLLELLVKKGVVTQEEASSLRQELEAKETAERELVSLKAEAAKKKAPAVTAKVPVRITGYAQIRGTAAEGENDSFLIRRARLSLLGDIAPGWDYKVQVDFGNTARKVVESVDFAKSKTKTTSVQRPLLLDAQANYALSKTDKFSFGQFKIPFSYENLTSSTDLDTINRAQVMEKLVPGRDNGSQGRDIGVQFGGVRERLDYFLGVFNGGGINASDDNDNKDLAARAVFHATDALALGASWYDGKAGASATTHDRLGEEVSYRQGPWTVRGEYVSGKDGTIRGAGWYAHAGYRFDPKWEAVARLDRFDPNRGVQKDISRIFTLGLNRFVTEQVKVQVNYERRADESKNTTDNALLAQLQLRF